MTCALRGREGFKRNFPLNQGIIEPIQYADWAAPIVPVLKEGGRVRIGGNDRLTVNHVAKLDTYYPIPKIEDLTISEIHHNQYL